MIQRIQTVYLVLGALAVAALGLFHHPWNTAPAVQYSWFVPALIAFMVATAGGAVGAIFLYNQRSTQRSVVIAVQFLTLGLTAVLYGGFYGAGVLTVRGAGGILWSKTVMFLLPIGAYGLFRLARRGIENDIELVRSMDRIR